MIDIRHTIFAQAKRKAEQKNIMMNFFEKFLQLAASACLATDLAAACNGAFTFELVNDGRWKHLWDSNANKKKRVKVELCN